MRAARQAREPLAVNVLWRCRPATAVFERM